jgi:hypothetical protein
MAEAGYLFEASLPYLIKLGVGIFHGYPDRGSIQDSCNARDVQTLKRQEVKAP